MQQNTVQQLNSAAVLISYTQLYLAHSKLWRGKLFNRKRKPHTLCEKQHQINKLANYQNIIVRNGPTLDRHVFVLSQNHCSMIFDVLRMISTQVRWQDPYWLLCNCENIVWISLRWLHTVLRAVSGNSPCELEPFSCDNLANDILANCQNCVQPPWENVWEVGIVIFHSQIVLEISTAKGVQKFLRHFKVYVVLLPFVNFSGLIRNYSFVSLLVNVPPNFWGHKDHVIKIF